MPYTGKQVLKDSLWGLVPSLTQVNIYIPDTKQVGLIYNRIFGVKGEFERLRYEFKLPVPMQSLLIVVGDKTYEVYTSVKELIVNFNVHRKTLATRNDVPEQLKSYVVSQVNGKNQYIKYIQDHMLFLEQTPMLTPSQTLYKCISDKYLGSMTPEQLVQVPKWQTSKCGEMLYEFIFNMHL